MIETFFKGFEGNAWLYLLWLVLLFASFLGWGALLVAVLRLRRLSAGFWPALGCAAVLIIGGWLNLFKGVSKESVFWVAAVGWCVLFIRWTFHWAMAFRTRQFKPKPPQAWGHWGLMIFTLPLLYGTLSEGAFRMGAPWPILDSEMAATVALPLKMVEAGGLGNDPFSERRLTGGFGGLYFFQAMAAAPLASKALPPVDGSLGHWILLATVFGWGRLRGLGGWRLAAVLLVVLGLRLNPNSFGGSHIVAALLLCLHAVFDQQAHRAFAETRSLASAILGAAILSLHPGCAVPTALLFALHFASGMLRHRPLWKPPLEWAATTLTLAAGLLPWMLALQTSSETLFFPFLGDGNHAGVPPPSWDAVMWAELPAGLLATRESLLVLLAAATMVGWAWRTRLSRDWEAGSLVFAVPLGIAAAYLFWPTLRPSLGEIYAAFLWAALLHAVIRLWAWTVGDSTRDLSVERREARTNSEPSTTPPAQAIHLAGGMAIFLLGSMAALAWQPSEIRRQIRYLVDPLRSWTLWETESPLQLADTTATRLHQSLQDSLPEYAALLDLTGQPHLYDLSRHRIFLCENPGSAGPRPGWPDSIHAENVLRYLRKGGIRYVAYSDFVLATSDTLTRQGRILRSIDSLQLKFPIRFEADGYRLLDLSDARKRRRY
jgi:hypothetical protein